MKQIEEIEHTKYIYDEIIFVMEYEKICIYFKNRVVGGNFDDFFCDEVIDIHQLNLGKFRKN